MKDKFMVKGTLAYAYDAKQGLMCYTNETTIAEMAGQYSMPSFIPEDCMISWMGLIFLSRLNLDA